MQSDPVDNSCSNWPTVRLKDITRKIGSGATPRGGSEAYLQNRFNFALIRSQNVFDRHFDSRGLAFISDEQAGQLKNVYLQPQDVLLNITGDGVTFGRCCMVPESVLPACVNQHVAIIRVNPDLADPGYVLSFLSWSATKAYIESFNSGGSRRAITKGNIELFEIPLPTLAEQRFIACVLSAIDRRIDLSRDMNITLEAIAQAIFKSWFVDFDPVKAKAEGREPEGVDDTTAALFPSEFEDSELGPIPRGWQIRCLDEVSEVGIGKTPPRGEHQWFTESPDDVKWVSIRDMGQTGFYIAESAERLTQGAIERFNIRIVPDNTVMVSFKLTIGRVCISDGQMATNEAIAHCRLSSASTLTTEFLFQYLKSFNYASLGSTSSIAEAVNSKSIKRIPVVVPSDSVLQAYAQMIGALFQRIKLNQRQAKTLEGIRDTLLPKLISGQICVPEAEALVNA